MVAHGTLERSLFGFQDIAAVATFPLDNGRLLEHLAVFHIA